MSSRDNQDKLTDVCAMSSALLQILSSDWQEELCSAAMPMRMRHGNEDRHVLWQKCRLLLRPGLPAASSV
jgi:hypothetical protein